MRNTMTTNVSGIRITTTLSLLSHLLSLVTTTTSLIIQPSEISLTGDLNLWDSIFSSRVPSVLVHPSEGDTHLVWTEGPAVLTTTETAPALLFGDTVTANIYLHDPHADTTTDTTTAVLRPLFETAGDAPADEPWRAEPGSNGIAPLPPPSPWIAVCQHGARRVSLFHLGTKERLPLVTHAPNGRRLNGPNDLAVGAEEDGGETYVYFTDPVYAWLEKERTADLPYLDERVGRDGPGYCGIYRFRLSSYRGPNGDVRYRAGEVELIGTMDRPNGLGFVVMRDGGGDGLAVSDCCQGTHLASCRGGTSRWKIFRRNGDGGWDVERVVEDTVPSSSFVAGCSDGFAVLESGGKGGGASSLLVASCADGLCIVDMNGGEVVARMRTVEVMNEGGQKCVVSNVAIGEDRVFLTGNCGVWQLGLARGGGSSSYEGKERVRSDNGVEL